MRTNYTPWKVVFDLSLFQMVQSLFALYVVFSMNGQNATLFSVIVFTGGVLAIEAILIAAFYVSRLPEAQQSKAYVSFALHYVWMSLCASCMALIIIGIGIPMLAFGLLFIAPVMWVYIVSYVVVTLLLMALSAKISVKHAN